MSAPYAPGTAVRVEERYHNGGEVNTTTTTGLIISRDASSGQMQVAFVNKDGLVKSKAVTTRWPDAEVQFLVTPDEKDADY